MGFFARLFGKRDHRDSDRGSNYYKREGFFSRLFDMAGSFSNSGRRYNNHYHDSDRRGYNTHYSDDSHRNDYSDRNYHRKKYRSSWS